ncbi:YncE family protein [Nonomuraea sp. NPDC005650]|uniref:YncE family protein n=1 Tax=Nonomuraea sp. NPDC005650 TaxID=3157045 RepID=UPI0033BD367B
MRLLAVMAIVLVGLTSCGTTSAPSEAPPSMAHVLPVPSAAASDVYAHDRPGLLSPVVAHYPARVYVPNSQADTLDVIDPATYKVIKTYRVGRRPQHVVPSWDLRTLWVNNNDGNMLTPVDPVTGKPGKPVRVVDPYNLYFSPDGSYALVMAERLNRLDFRDPHTMRLDHSLKLPCRGVNHGDFTADGGVFLVSCEFSGRLLAIDWRAAKVLKIIDVGAANMPQDVKLSPDGTLFYCADMAAGGLWLVDARTFAKVGFVRTGKGAHGLYVSRDSRVLYVSNRGEGSVSVVSFATRRKIAKWRLPGGGSPDMGGVSADGRQLWLSGRYNGVVYVISTSTGKLIRKVKVGAGPHGLCVYPQPGRYSLGHTGVFR